jgi:phosphohistidine phosphatase
MKTLLILRHAKSSWDEPGLADIQRPLNKRGKHDAPRVGQLLKETGIVPDIILSSPAVRAMKTAEAVADTAGFEGEIKIQENLYPGSPGDYIEVLNELPDNCVRAMVVGHNPGLEELLNDLTGEAEPLPTAALAQVDLPIQRWIDLDDQVLGKVVRIWRIKELD